MPFSLWEDTDSYSADNDCSSNCSSARQEPIVVGYAFGPKKMSTMGVVMAEASRAEVIHEDEEELFYGDYDTLHQEATTTKASSSSSTLTSAALEGLERTTSKQQQPQNSTIISLGNSNDTNLKHIVRYFRSSCSSAAASMSETTVSTPTTATTFTSKKKHRFPVRISFVPLDPDIPLEEQHGGNFDLILHKLTEDILSMNEKEASWNRIQKLKDYHAAKDCCLVDDPTNVQTLMSRSDIAHVLQTLDVTSASGIPVKAPKFLVVQDTTLNLQERLEEAQLRVPLIVKPLIAAGTKQSHYMTIVLQESAIANKIPPKSLIQEYVNHNATLYKVYVLGESVHVYQRPSLPNLPSSYPPCRDLVEFDSQRPYPRLQDFGIMVGDHVVENTSNTHSSTPTPGVTRDEVRPIVEALKKAFGLELFGFDILVNSTQPEWLVVDVNYFPSYKEVPNFPSLLAQYLTQRVLEKRRTKVLANRR
jgi:inositol-1,3,4-trisphosphate 5/6-kinase/inositol-tetrakisphosphate 1-kinase